MRIEKKARFDATRIEKKARFDAMRIERMSEVQEQF